MSQDPKGKSSVYQKACNGLIWSLRPLSLPVDVILHKSAGERHAGFGVWPALALIIAVAVASPESQVSLFILAGVFLLRAMMSCRSRNGESVHTWYPGQPLLGLFRNRFSRNRFGKPKCCW
jgi:hypothetical protein